MVPMAELLAKRSALTESISSSLADFPPWTRGDDSEDESAAESQERKRLSDGRRGRSRRRRDTFRSPREKDSGRDISPSLAHGVVKRGLLKGLLEPVVNDLVGAAKGGDDKGPPSDDSGHDSDHPHSSAYKPPPPETAEPSSIVGSPTSYPSHDAPPPPSPSPPSLQLPQTSTGARLTPMPSAAPPSPVGGQNPKQVSFLLMTRLS